MKRSSLKGLVLLTSLLQLAAAGASAQTTQPAPIPPIPVPPPQLACAAPAPPDYVDPPASPTSGPTLNEKTGEIEIWRDTSVTPQVPERLPNQFKEALVVGNQPVALNLKFDPLAGGKVIFVSGTEGLAIAPAGGQVVIDANGEAIATVLLEQGFSNGVIIVSMDGRRTFMPVTRASVSEVEAAEAASGGAQ